MLAAVSLDAALLGAPLAGAVLGVYRRAATLVTDGGRVITLAAPELGNGPDAVLVAQAEWPAGARFRADGRGLRFSRGPEICWQGATRWSPADLAPPWPARHNHAAALAAALAGPAPQAGLLPVVLGHPPHDAAQARLAQRATPLLAALPAPHAATALIGLGPGLTPAGDDLIAGLLLTLHYGQHAAAPALRAVAQRAATTTLGRAMLGWAAQGRASEHTLQLLGGLFALPASAALALLPAVLEHGATSGADLVAGILIGLRILGSECGSNQPN